MLSYDDEIAPQIDEAAVPDHTWPDSNYDMQQAAQLMRLLAGLPGAQREAFVLQQEAGRSVEEIAAAVVADGVTAARKAAPVPAAEAESSRESAVADQTAPARQSVAGASEPAETSAATTSARPAFNPTDSAVAPTGSRMAGQKRKEPPRLHSRLPGPRLLPRQHLPWKYSHRKSGWKKSLDCASRAEPRKPANCSSSSENAIRIIPCPLRCIESCQKKI